MSAPQLRFHGEKGKWQTDSLKNITSYVDYRGKTPEKSESGVFLVTAKNIRQGYIDYKSSEEFIPAATYEEVMRRGKPAIGDVLITTEAPLGFVASVDRDDIALAQRVIKFRGEASILHNNFLKYSLLSVKFQKELNEKATGGTVKGIKGSVLHKMKLTFPEIAEQTKIANFLTAVDEKLSQLNRKHDLLTQYKKGVMQQIFSQELRFKDDNGREFPEWDVVELEKIAAKVNKKNKDSAINNVLTNSATQGIVSQSDYFEREIANQNNLGGYYIVEIDDFVYNPRISANALVGPIKRNSLAAGVMSPLYTVFRFKAGNLDFIEQYFHTTHWHDYMKSVSNSGARHDRMNITNESFLGLPIPYPCLKEQTKIANFLTAIDEKISAAKTQLETVKQYKQGLLQQMFV